MGGVNKDNKFAYYANGHYYAWSTFDAGQKWDDTINHSKGVIIHGSAGYLATITDANENDFVLNYSNKGKKIEWVQNRGAWLGGPDSDKYGQIEKRWVWRGGEDSPEYEELLGYLNWSDNQPDDAGGGHGEDFLELLPDGGKWNDIKGGADSGVHAFITEWGVAGA